MAAPRPSRSALIRRRAIAVSIAAALTGGLWLALVRGDDSDQARGERAGAGVPGPVAELIAALEPEELADQVLLLGFEGTDATTPFLDELGERQLGGVLVGPANWPGAAQGSALVDELRAAGASGGRVPPLIATSQEGGPYRALADLPPDATQLQVGESASLATAEEWARETAAALRRAGIQLNLAPVADVATLDSPVADRAFSDDPVVAAQMTTAAVRGCAAEGVACAVAHFPGLGAASQDTNSGPATVGLDPATLATRDLEPFRTAFAAGARAVVLSLAFYSAYDPVTPGALVEPIATGLLREELGFEGLAVTDDLGAGAVRSGYRVADAAVLALAAGADMVQIGSPADQAGVRDEILAALEDGRLDPARLGEAAGRVLELKQAIGLIDLP